MTNVRVRPARALTLGQGEGTILHLAGDELELPDDEASALAAQGFVEPLKAERRRGATRGDSDPGDEALS